MLRARFRTPPGAGGSGAAVRPPFRPPNAFNSAPRSRRLSPRPREGGPTCPASHLPAPGASRLPAAFAAPGALCTAARGPGPGSAAPAARASGRPRRGRSGPEGGREGAAPGIRGEEPRGAAGSRGSDGTC